MCRHDAGKALNADGDCWTGCKSLSSRGCVSGSPGGGKARYLGGKRRQTFDGKAAILRAPTGVFVQFRIESRHGRERSAPLMLLNTSRQT